MADLIVTDPPYNVNVENSQGMKIQNDNMGSEEFKQFLTQAFTAMAEALKAGGSVYIWHADVETVNFAIATTLSGLKIVQFIYWIKNTFVLGRKDYQVRHEPCIYARKEGAPHYFIDDRTISTVKEDEKPDFDKMDKNELKELLEKIYGMPCTILHEDKPLKNESHPDMKPVNLFGTLIKNSSRPGEKVLDTFGGSGTTIVACEQLGRKAYVMELDPCYAAATIERWEKLTGKKAEKIA